MQRNYGYMLLVLYLRAYTVRGRVFSVCVDGFISVVRVCCGGELLVGAGDICASASALLCAFIDAAKLMLERLREREP